MNILMLGQPYLRQALHMRGHNALSANWSKSAEIDISHPVNAKALLEQCASRGFAPDLLLYMDDGNLPTLIDPENIPCPAIYYSIDTYCNPWHVAYAHGFDKVLVAQKDFLSLFTNDKLNASWFPLFNPDENNYTADAEDRDIPVSFVGTLGHPNNPDREPFVKRFRKLHPLFTYRGVYREIFGRSKIVLNQTAFSEINFRFFEATACGAALLTEQCANGFSELFTPGENILPPYPRNDAPAAAAIARQYLEQPELLKEIAIAGREHVCKYHGTNARASALESTALDLRSQVSDKARLAAQRRYGVRTSFAMIASELNKPELAAHRAYFLKLGCSS